MELPLCRSCVYSLPFSVFLILFFMVFILYFLFYSAFDYKFTMFPSWMISAKRIRTRNREKKRKYKYMLQSLSTPIKMATKDTSLTHGINSLHLVCRLKIMIRLKNHNKLQHSLDLCCCAVFVSFIVCLQVRCGLCVCYMFCVCGYICECLCEFVYLCARMCVFISMRLWVSTYTFLFVCVYNICIFIQKCFQ